MMDESLLERVRHRIESGDVELPARNRIVLEVQGLARQDDYDADAIVSLIESDPALTAAMLRTANSTFYGGLVRIATVRDAMVRIGVDEVVRMAFLAGEKQRYRVQDPALQQLILPLWRHAVGCAIGAEWLAKRLGFEELMHEAFVCGLVHDIGKLLLLWVIDDLKQGTEELPAITPTLISEVFKSAHTDEGFRLGEAWALPEHYCTVIRDHHKPHPDPNDSLMLLVRLANRACWRLGLGLHHDPSIVLAATEEAHHLAAGEILQAELEIALEDSERLAA